MMSTSSPASGTQPPLRPDSPAGTFGTFGRSSSKGTLGGGAGQPQSASSRDSSSANASQDVSSRPTVAPPLPPPPLTMSPRALEKQRADDDYADGNADFVRTNSSREPSGSSSLDPRTHWQGWSDPYRETPSPLQQHTSDSESPVRRAAHGAQPGSGDGDGSSGPRYGFGERGGYDAGGSTLERTRSPQSDQVQRERARLLEEDRQREEKQYLQQQMSFLAGLPTPRSPRLRQPGQTDLHIDTGDRNRTPRTSSAHRRRIRSGDSVGGDTIQQQQQQQQQQRHGRSRPLSLTDSSERQRSRSSRRKHQSLTFSVPDDGSSADDEAERARPVRRSPGRRESRRHRAHSAPTPGMGGAPMVRSHASMGRPSATVDEEDRPAEWTFAGPLGTTVEAVAMEQRRQSDAHAASALAYTPRFPPMIPMTVDRSRGLLPRVRNELEDGSMEEKSPWQGRLLAADRASLPLRIAIPIAIALFLDFNVLFIQAQLAIHADSDGAATVPPRQSTAWWISFAVYALCPILSIGIFILKLVSNYKQQTREEGAEARKAYLNDVGRLLLTLRSSAIHKLVHEVDQAASSEQRRLERAWRLRQAWPHALLALPRVAILLVALILYSPYQGSVDPSPSTAMRDDFFFATGTGLLSTYGFAVTIVAIVWHGMSALMVTLAAVLVHIGARRDKHRTTKHRGMLLTSHKQPTALAHRPKSSISFPNQQDQLEMGPLTGEAGGMRDLITFKAGRAWQRNTQDRLRLALLRHGERDSRNQGIAATPLFDLVDHRSATQLPGLRGPQPTMRELDASSGARVSSSSRLRFEDYTGMGTTSQTLVQPSADSRQQHLPGTNGPASALPPGSHYGSHAASLPFPAIEFPPRRSSSSFRRPTSSSDTERAPVPASAAAAAPTASPRQGSMKSIGTTGSALWGAWFRQPTRDSLYPSDKIAADGAAGRAEDTDGSPEGEAQEELAHPTAATREFTTGRVAPVTIPTGLSRVSMYGEVGDGEGEESPPAAPHPAVTAVPHDSGQEYVEHEQDESGDTLDTDETDPEERRLWSTFPEQSRRHPPGLIALEMQERQQLEKEQRERKREQAPTSAAPAGSAGNGLEDDSPMTSSLTPPEQPGMASAASMGWSRYPISGSGLTAIQEESSYAPSSVGHSAAGARGGNGNSLEGSATTTPTTANRPSEGTPQQSMPASPTESAGEG